MELGGHEGAPPKLGHLIQFPRAHGKRLLGKTYD